MWEGFFMPQKTRKPLDQAGIAKQRLRNAANHQKRRLTQIQMVLRVDKAHAESLDILRAGCKLSRNAYANTMLFPFLAELAMRMPEINVARNARAQTLGQWLADAMDAALAAHQPMAPRRPAQPTPPIPPTDAALEFDRLFGQL
jgi:hypothetical protein